MQVLLPLVQLMLKLMALGIVSISPPALIFDMKANARLILLLLSIIFSVLAFVFIYSSSNDYHAKKKAIDKAIKQEKNSFCLLKKKSGCDSKLTFESKRKEELGSDLEALRLDLEKSRENLLNNRNGSQIFRHRLNLKNQ